MDTGVFLKALIVGSVIILGILALYAAIIAITSDKASTGDRDSFYQYEEDNGGPPEDSWRKY